MARSSSSSKRRFIGHLPASCAKSSAMRYPKQPRNIKGFMIQGGDAAGTGKGMTSIWGKKFNDEIRESLKKFRTSSIMLGGSFQWRIVVQIPMEKQPHLNGLYTVFGKVIHGFEVLDLMEKMQTGSGDCSFAKIRMNHVTIHANPLAG